MDPKAKPISSALLEALAKSQDWGAQHATTAVEKSYRQKCARKLRALQDQAISVAPHPKP
jgi:hypothetical protein